MGVYAHMCGGLGERGRGVVNGGGSGRSCIRIGISLDWECKLPF